VPRELGFASGGRRASGSGARIAVELPLGRRYRVRGAAAGRRGCRWSRLIAE